ncbi:reverse transcriptase domain-containing protein [Tanacetum coccineum]
MIQYMGKVKVLANSFKKFSIKQVPRSENKKADALSKITSTSFAHLTKQVLVEVLKEKSINEVEVLTVVEEEGNTWMTPIYEYLMEETLPAERKKARAVRLKSRRMHAGPMSVVAKAIRTGYYWPTMHKDARKVIRKFQDCQVHHPVPWNPQKKFGLPGEIISENGKQFRDNPFKDWCEKLNIRQHFASVKHPQTNGLVERENRSLGEGIKARLDKRSKDLVIPAEIGMPTLRTTVVDMVQNDEALKLNLDLLEEKREQAAICEARSKAKMENYYNSRVRNTSFKSGDPVYRSNDAIHTKDGGKLGPKWEGPYEVTEALGKRAYKLRDRNGKILPRTWNVRNLKKCYVHEM